MKISFLETLATVGETYRRGRVYDLDYHVARQFVQEGLAVDAGEKPKADEVLTPVEHRVEPIDVEKPKAKAKRGRKGAK